MSWFRKIAEEWRKYGARYSQEDLAKAAALYGLVCRYHETLRTETVHRGTPSRDAIGNLRGVLRRYEEGTTPEIRDAIEATNPLFSLKQMREDLAIDSKRL